MPRFAIALSLLVLGYGCGRDPERARGPDPRPDPDSGITVTSGTRTTPTVSGSFLSATPPIGCADPARRAVQAFDPYLDPAWAGQPFQDVSDFAIEQASGVAVADWDGDGRLDVVVADFAQPRFFAQTSAGVFTDLTDAWMPETEMIDNATGVTPVDIDGDGDLDLALSRTLRLDRILVNTGSHFELGQVLSGDTAVVHSTSSSWADIDGDGDLDGYIANYGIPHGPWDYNFVLQNQGDGTVVDISAQFPEELLSGHTLAGGWHDIDGDGDPDLYVVNDFGKIAIPNQVGWNEGGEFASNLAIQGLHAEMAGMGVSGEDENGDGLLDFLASGWKTVHYLVSFSPSLWVNATAAAGFPALWSADEDRRLVWGNDQADLDNDGDLDVYLSFGYLRNTFAGVGNPFEQRDAILTSDGAGAFTEVTDAWGYDNQGVSRGVVVVDLNDDGWLDLVVQDLAGPPRMFLARCGEGSWLRVRLHQDGPNPFAVGAQITAVSGDRSWTRRIRAGGSSIASSGPPEVHFGLGELEVLDRLEVRWPDGEVVEFEGVDLRTIATVTRIDAPEAAR